MPLSHPQRGLSNFHDWYQFRDARVNKRMMDWFRREGLEVEFH
jgi:hypothetical protein